MWFILKQAGTHGGRASSRLSVFQRPLDRGDRGALVFEHPSDGRGPLPASRPVSEVGLAWFVVTVEPWDEHGERLAGRGDLVDESFESLPELDSP